MQVKVSKSSTPALWAFVVLASNFRASNSVGEWGDGKFLEQLILLFEKLAPMFMSCFVTARAKARFVETMKNLTDTQKARMLKAAKQHVRRFDDLAEDERMSFAEEGTTCILGTLEVVSEFELGNCFDELHAARN